MSGDATLGRVGTYLSVLQGESNGPHRCNSDSGRRVKWRMGGIVVWGLISVHHTIISVCTYTLKDTVTGGKLYSA